jgi:hypothetical protein
VKLSARRAKDNNLVLMMQNRQASRATIATGPTLLYTKVCG